MGIFSTAVLFNNQSFKESVNYCVANKSLFIDHTFSASIESLSPQGLLTDLGDIAWKRPSDLCSNPRLFESNMPSYICQGEISTAWLLSSLSVISTRKDCLRKLIPNYEDQDWNPKKPEKYLGIFVFNFWRHGEWIEVIIDDQLPTRNNKLISIHSPVENEFWCALIEKAYAKILGSYELLLKGSEEEALLDFTGGVPEEIYDISATFCSLDKMLELFDLLNKEHNNESLLVASVKYEDRERLENGLLTTHCYNVTGVREMNIKNTSLMTSYNKDKLLLIRLCNPWWDKQWNGAFAEGSKEWKLLSSSEKMRMGFTSLNEGEFWILFQDFIQNFSRVTIIRLLNTTSFSLKTTWYESQSNEFWYGGSLNNDKAIEGSGGGGQFYFEINRPSGDTVLINILQKCLKGAEIPMGVVLYQVERNRQTMLFSTRWAKLVEEYHIDNTRCVGLRYVLKPGSYVIKSYIKNCPPKSEQLFYHIRVYTTATNNGRFLQSEPLRKAPTLCPCMIQEASLITRIRIVKASNLTKRVAKGFHNAYCEIECESEYFQTTICKDTDCPEWEESFLFYRVKPESPISIRIYHKCTLLDDFLGMVVYNFDNKFLNKDPVLIKSGLKPRDPNKMENMPGTVEVAFWHTDSYVNL